MTDTNDISAPTSLLEAVAYYADKDRALAFLVEMRWPNGVTCPACEAGKPIFLKTRRIWKCRDCKRQFSVKLGTIFEDSPLGLDKWLPALWMLANCRNGISSYEISRDLHANASAVQLTLTACLIGIALGQLILGPISDRVGRRPPLLIGLGAGLLAVYAPRSIMRRLSVLIGLVIAQGLLGAVQFFTGVPAVLVAFHVAGAAACTAATAALWASMRQRTEPKTLER